MDKLTEEEVLHVADLGKLELSKEEVERFSYQLKTLFNEIDKVNEINVTEEEGMIIPVVITIYADRSFTFITKTPPAAVLIKKTLKLEKGSGEPNKNKVSKITREQLKEIAEKKMQDLNASNIDSAIKIIAGTARSMGVEVVN